MPSGFVDTREIEDFLGAVEKGTEYLSTIMPDINGNPFAFAVEAHIQNVNAKLKEFRKLLGKRPALLDRRHPAYVEMCRKAQKAAEETERQQVDSMLGQGPRLANGPRQAVAPLLLVPARPTELPVS